MKINRSTARTYFNSQSTKSLREKVKIATTSYTHHHHTKDASDDRDDLIAVDSYFLDVDGRCYESISWSTVNSLE